MTRDRIEELWSRFLSNETLSATDERELLEALEADPALRRELLGEARIDGWLGVRGSNLRDAEAPIRRFLKQVGAEKDESGFIKKMESRLGSVTRRKAARPAPDGSSSWNLLLAAAGLLIGIVVLVMLLSDPAQPVKVVRPTPTPSPTRAAVEAKLQQIDRERERLIQAPSPQKPEEKVDRKRMLAELDEQRRRTEDELKEAIERARKTPVVAQSEQPKPDPVVTPKDPLLVPATSASEAMAATLERMEGAVQIGKLPARPDQGIRAGQGIETGAKSLAVIRYPDGTRVELGESTVLGEVKDGAKRVALEKGLLRSQIAKQPKDQPMIFATPQGEAKVLGTTLRLAVDADPRKGARLNVEEGKVEFKNLAGKTVLVEGGHYAVSAAGAELLARTFPIEEVVLLASAGKVSGGEWRPVKDDKALRGQAWETASATPTAPEPALWKDFYASVARVNERRASYVEFRFAADADKDYIVWIRGVCVAPGPSAAFCDQLAIEGASARVSRTQPVFKDNPAIGEFNGHVIRPGYWWVSGDADSGPLSPPKEPTDTIPLTIRFSRPGPQVLRLYALSSLMRVDAILLTTIRKTRPEESFVPPGAEPK